MRTAKDATERPITFGGWAMPKLLNDTKTQTRRVMRQQPGSWDDMGMQENIVWADDGISGPGWYLDAIVRPGKYQLEGRIKCPYGVPGDVLWVKEHFYVQPEIWAQHHDKQPIHYAADVTREQVEDYVGKSPRYMPRWASRITLEITQVRVGRVQDISDEDTFPEGVTGERAQWRAHPGIIWKSTPRKAFIYLWDSIYEKRGYGWEVNPHVWALTFRRIADG